MVVHLAFIIFGDHEQAHRVNLEGSRNVFEAVAAAGARRLVYTSSVAAYGFEGDRGWLTEEMPASGSDRFYYSAHKAELEGVLRRRRCAGSRHRGLRAAAMHRRRRPTRRRWSRR